MVSISRTLSLQHVDPIPERPWPRVTVVTPSYNQAQYLEATIRSVISQGYPNLEYIVMDGGSSDGSVDIIRRYDSFIDYWESVPDRGQSHAINKGWQRATGEILAYLNSDDLFRSGAIHSSVAYLHDRPDASLVYGFANVIDEHGRLLYRMRPGEIDVAQMLQQNQMPQPTVFFRRSLLERFGLFDESLHFDLEYEFWLRAVDTTVFGRLPQFTADMRLHADCKSAAQSERFYPEHLRVLDKLFSRPGPWSAEPAMMRSAYLPVVLYGVGTTSVFSADERARAAELLRQMSPVPSPSEVASVIAFHDSARAELESSRLDRSVVDSAGILSALEGELILTRQDIDRIRRRVGALAVARAAGGRRLFQHIALLAESVRRDPGIVTFRPWWSSTIKAIPFGWSAVHAFRLMRDHGPARFRRSISKWRVLIGR